MFKIPLFLQIEVKQFARQTPLDLPHTLRASVPIPLLLSLAGQPKHVEIMKISITLNIVTPRIYENNSMSLYLYKCYYSATICTVLNRL